MTLIVYATLSDTPCTAQLDPRTAPQCGKKLINQTQQDINKIFHEQKRIFDNNHNMNLALKSLVIEVVEKKYIWMKSPKNT